MNLTTNELMEVAWTQLWQVTVLIAVIAFVVRFACRHRTHLAHLLWMLVVIKCLTPPVWSSPSGLFSWARVETSVIDATQSNLAVEDWRLDPSSNSGSLSQHVNIDEIPSVAPPAPRSFLPAMAIGLWLLGALSLGGFLTARLSRYYRAVRTFGHKDPRIETIAGRLAVRLRVRQNFRVAVTSADIGPAMFGIFQPTLLIPRALADGKPADEIKLILAHELVHLRRGDALCGIVQLLAQVVWWFHPLVWWVNREVCRQRELCCDEETVAGIECSPARYARCLIDALELNQQQKPGFALPSVDGAQITTNRLEHIMKRGKHFHARMPRAYWSVVVLIGFVVLPGDGLTLDASPQVSDQTSSSEDADGSAKASTGLTGAEPRAATRLGESLGGDTDDKRDWEAESFLKGLGVRIRRDDEGRVYYAGAHRNSTTRPIVDSDLKYFTSLNWRIERSAHRAVPFATSPDPNLRIVASNITDDGILELSQLQSVRFLDLNGNKNITDAGLAHLRRFPNLEKLWLPGVDITDVGVATLAKLPALTALWISGPQITDSSLELLSEMKQLSTLAVVGAPITDAGLAHLRVTKVTNLDFHGTQITDDGLRHLEDMTDLTRLRLGGNSLTVAGLNRLRGLSKLNALYLDGTHVTDAWLANMERFPHLAWLTLNDTEVSDVGIRHLERLADLVHVDLRRTNVSRGGVARLQAFLLDCEIRYP